MTAEDRERIAAAIRAVEARTAGELVVVIARESDDYRYVPLLWAALAALLLPFPLIWLTLWPALHIQLAAVSAFVVLALGLSWAPVKRRVVPRAARRRAARKAAREQFLARNMHLTAARTGVLLFVSLAERYAEIVADQGIDAKVDKGVWQEAVATLVDEGRAGRLAEGVLRAIASVGEVLAAHVPPRPADENELPNHVVEL